MTSSKWPPAACATDALAEHIVVFRRVAAPLNEWLDEHVGKSAEASRR